MEINLNKTDHENLMAITAYCWLLLNACTICTNDDCNYIYISLPLLFFDEFASVIDDSLCFFDEFTLVISHWRIQGGRQGRAPPPGSKFFHFHAVFGKNLKNNSNFGSWRTPLGKNLDPPLLMIL